MTGSDFVYIQAYRDEIVAYQEDYERIMLAAETEIQEMTTARRDNMHKLWIKMAEAAGLDAQDTWESPNFIAEHNYVDEGFGGIVKIPARMNPTAPVTQDITSEELDDEPAPENQVLN